jgi:NAD(P)-dependent dehydrogenase (short-subunit alcohol dehydrogenase family)
MKHIVITGSTRGIGFGLAKAFLEQGCSVTVSGRTLEAAVSAQERLGSTWKADRIQAASCDVTSYEQVQAMWQKAFDQYGKVDMWVNNAGASGPTAPVWQMPPAEAQAVVSGNVLGVMYGSIVAAQGMLAQGYGAIYNMEGMGADGSKHDGLAYYGTTKYAIRYYTDCLAQELRGTALIVGALRPGMVITELVTGQYADRPQDFERVKKVFNIIADRVENVAPWLARRMLENQQSGVRLRYMSGEKLLWRFVSAPFSKRDLFKSYDDKH